MFLKSVIRVGDFILKKLLGSLPGGEFSDPFSEQVDLLVPITVGDRTKLFDEVSIYLFKSCFA